VQEHTDGRRVKRARARRVYPGRPPIDQEIRAILQARATYLYSVTFMIAPSFENT